MKLLIETVNKLKNSNIKSIIDKKMIEFEELDLYLWYEETGKVLK